VPRPHASAATKSRSQGTDIVHHPCSNLSSLSSRITLPDDMLWTLAFVRPVGQRRLYRFLSAARRRRRRRSDASEERPSEPIPPGSRLLMRKSRPWLLDDGPMGTVPASWMVSPACARFSSTRSRPSSAGSHWSSSRELVSSPAAGPISRSVSGTVPGAASGSIRVGSTRDRRWTGRRVPAAGSKAGGGRKGAGIASIGPTSAMARCRRNALQRISSAAAANSAGAAGVSPWSTFIRFLNPPKSPMSSPSPGSADVVKLGVGSAPLDTARLAGDAQRHLEVTHCRAAPHGNGRTGDTLHPSAATTPVIGPAWIGRARVQTDPSLRASTAQRWGPMDRAAGRDGPGACSTREGSSRHSNDRNMTGTCHVVNIASLRSDQAKEARPSFCQILAPTAASTESSESCARRSLIAVAKAA
jgi:hypothetical protein